MKRFIRILATIVITVAILCSGFFMYQMYDLSIYNLEETTELYRIITQFISAQNLVHLDITQEFNTLQTDINEVNTRLVQLAFKQSIINTLLLKRTAKPNIAKLRVTTVEIKVGKVGGAGVIITFDEEYLYILTAKHIIIDKGKVDVKVTDVKGKTKIVKNISRDNIYKDELVDLALIKVPKPDRNYLWLPITLRRPLVGSTVYTMGHPYNFHYTVTEGIVSNYADRIFANKSGNYMMISAPIYPGNSGGAVINNYTQLIGIAVGVIYTEEGGMFSQRKVQHNQLSIAIKLDDIYRFMAIVAEQEKIKNEEKNSNRPETSEARK